jgi:hypothetical protein
MELPKWSNLTLVLDHFRPNTCKSDFILDQFCNNTVLPHILGKSQRSTSSRQIDLNFTLYNMSTATKNIYQDEIDFAALALTDAEFAKV